MTPTTDDWWKEWSKAREIIDKCEDRVHDVRKGGFSLISGLLTAGAIFGGKLDEQTQAHIGLPLSVMFLALLVGIAVAEKQAMITLSGAASRCRFLEALSPVELTETITYRFGMDRSHRYTLLLYVLFGFAGVLVGIALTVSPLTTSGIIAVAIIYFVALSRLYTLQPQAGPGADLFVDRVECEVGELVTIALMNHTDEPQPFDIAVATIQHVLDVDGSKPKGPHPPSTLQLPNCPATAGGKLQAYRAVTWLWRANEPGVYCINRATSIEGMVNSEHDRTLRKMLRVRPTAQGLQTGQVAAASAFTMPQPKRDEELGQRQ